MRKAVIFFAVLIPCMWIACSSDENGGTDSQDTRVRVTAYVTTSEPLMDNVNHPLWDSVSATGLMLNKSGTSVGKILSIPDSVSLQVIRSVERLFLRIVWSDNARDRTMDYYKVFNVDPVTPWLANFVEVKDIFFEDQLFVMFKDPTAAPTQYDTWNWQAYSTDPVGLAEGLTYRNDSLIPDPSTPQREIASRITSVGSRPLWAPYNGPEWDFNTILFKEDAVYLPYNDSTDWVWEIGDSIPGWFIDGVVAQDAKNDPDENQWDILAKSEYDDIADTYTLVLSRKLSTGHNEDLDMAAVDKLEARIGVMDDKADLGKSNSSDQRFTNEFVILFQ